MSQVLIPAEMVEIALLSVDEKSREHVTALMMCEHAIKTGLKLLTLPELEQYRKPVSLGIYIAPIDGGEGEVSIFLYEVTSKGINIRFSAASMEAGWAVKYRWMFRR